MGRGLLLLYFALVCSGVLGAPKCGKKRTLKAKYGRSGEFQSVEGIASTCNYRIRAPRGFHIKLTFDNFQTDPNIFQVWISGASGAASNALTIPGSRGTHVAEFSNIVIKIVTSRAATAVSISYEATIPADGNAGYDFRASKKAKVIKSPGFPRIKLPSNVRSIWNIEANEGQAVALQILSFSTASDDDYLQVMDGSNVIAKHSGKKRKSDLPIIHQASSGKMVISLYTSTPNSKGFKAKVFVADLTSVVRPGVTTPSSGGLRCHKRNRVMMSSGTVVSDDYTGMTCADDEICGRMVVEGTSAMGGRSMTLVSENLNCLPRTACTGRCPESPVSSVSINSCKITCCSTDWCNSSPDGPKVPPTTSSTRSPPTTVSPTLGSGIRCYYIIQSEAPGATEINQKTETPCSPGFSCMRIEAEASSAEGKVSTVFGSCLPTANCDTLDCNMMSSVVPGMTIEGCRSHCCDTDLCNEQPIPSSTPPASSGIQCFDVLQISAAGTMVSNKKNQTSCDSGSSCMRIEAETSMSGLKASTVYGNCFPTVACNSLNCNMMAGAVPGMKVQSCRAHCCDTDLCNDQTIPATAPSLVASSSPGTGTSRTCHQKMKMMVSGVIMPGTNDTIQTCPPSSQCLKMTAEASHSSISGITVAIEFGSCAPASSCGVSNCDSVPIPPSAGIKINSCDITCCSGDLCNA